MFISNTRHLLPRNLLTFEILWWCTSPKHERNCNVAPTWVNLRNSWLSSAVRWGGSLQSPSIQLKFQFCRPHTSLFSLMWCLFRVTGLLRRRISWITCWYYVALWAHLNGHILVVTQIAFRSHWSGDSWSSEAKQNTIFKQTEANNYIYRY